MNERMKQASDKVQKQRRHREDHTTEASPKYFKDHEKTSKHVSTSDTWVAISRRDILHVQL